MDVAVEGDAGEVWKTSDAETPVDFFQRLKESLRRRDGLEEGAVTVAALARWCWEVGGGRVDASGDFETLEDLTEYLRLVLHIVQEQSLSFRGSGALEGAVDGLDADESLRQAAEHLANVGPQSARTVFGWHKISEEPSPFRDVGRLERAHPLEFPMGIGGLHRMFRSLRAPKPATLSPFLG